MNTFKHKSLYAALAGLGALGATGVAQAVSVNPDGLGQVLIYPYYTVRTVPTGLVGSDAAYNSLLSVVNSTASAKAVKVRFLEGKNSREVLDFNLYLSAKDVWTAAVVPTVDGAGIFTKDKSCTVPKVSTSQDNPTSFLNYGYVGDTGGDSLDRTREGYLEIIELGDVIGSTAAAVTHNAAGVPACTDSALVEPTAPANTIPGSGGLFGSVTIINVLKGEEFASNATALDGFSTTSLWTNAGSILPTLANVNPKTSVVVSGTNVYITPNWNQNPATGGNAVDPVSAVLMANNVYNEFVLDVETRSSTDWVVTFPTKREYVFVGTGPAQKLFQNNFKDGKSCDDITLTLYDREERTRQATQDFSPPPPVKATNICWEANVLTYILGGGSLPSQSSAFGSKNFIPISSDFANGWVAMNFPLVGSAHRLVGPGSTVFNTANGVTTQTTSTTFYGLPVIGFSSIIFENGTLTSGGLNIQSNYGANYNHRTTRSIVTQ